MSPDLSATATPVESKPAPVAGPTVDARPATGGSAVRQLVEALVSLALAVIVFRAFALEGYIISTGSMAPNLFGFHKRIACPDCGFRFACGVAFDRDYPDVSSGFATCPNCGQTRIDISAVPRNDGDQLLVFKNAFDLRDPRRWEIAVFQCPHNPRQPYVKRLVGLPGELIQIREGDLFVNGQRAKKPLELQRAMRIPVFDNDYPGSSTHWLPRWVASSGWQPVERHFEVACTDDCAEPTGQTAQRTDSQQPVRDKASRRLDVSQESPVQLLAHRQVPNGKRDESQGRIHWLRYLQWPRLGDAPPDDSDETNADDMSTEPGPDDGSPEPDPQADPNAPGIAGFNPQARLSTGTGSTAVSAALVQTEQPPTAMEPGPAVAGPALPGPIQDEYGYNRRRFAVERVAVADLMLSCEVRFSTTATSHSNADAFLAVLRHRDRLVLCAFRPAERQVDAWVLRRGSDIESVVAGMAPMASAPLKPEWFHDESELTRLEVSTFDSVLTVAIADQTVLSFDFEALNLDAAADSTSSAIVEADDERLSPVWLGAVGIGVELRHLTLFRDVHYTSPPQSHATTQPLRLGHDEFFALGDNSPVSLDSRGWISPAVPRRLLVGKPLVVHLPSQPGRLQLGDRVTHVRLPDFSRMRIIR